ncbi:MAG TPA: undecaprenyl diphosphate synthase family protein [Ilumatobacteraceae bacterium]
MAAPITSSSGAANVSELSESALRHMMIVGGTLAEWAAFADAEWDERVEVLGAELARVGAAWLTLRPYEAGTEAVELIAWHRAIGACGVVVDPAADGRERFAAAMRSLEPDHEVNEATVAGALYDPADSEPDLVLVLGPPTQLPPSLVWELAYAELVFTPIAWQDLSVDHVRDAIADFAGRRRRFGGLDE